MVTLGSVSRGLKDIYIVRFDIGYLSLQVPENNTSISPDNSKKSNNSDPIIMDFGTIPDGYEYVSSQELGFHRYYQVGIFNWLQYGFQPTKTTKISISEGIDFPKVLNEDSEARVIVPGLSDRSKLNTTNNVFKSLQPLSIMAVVAFVVWVLSILADASGRFRYVPCGYLSTFSLLCHFIFAICYSIASTKYASKIRSHVTASVLSVPTGLGLLWASFVVQLISAVTHKARNVPFSQSGSTDEPHDHHHVQV
ncbi:hypothetical protein JA9_000774 [Meyerozyma sp. JA9]|nr:hypothetical protein JA9_000774 [Meyerozyma sp. JA9]